MALTDITKFAAVTVFDAKIYKNIDWTDGKYNYNTIKGKVEEFTLDTLKVSNITAEGPSLTITGGKNDDVLVKRGKKYRMEIQDALGTFKALETFGMGKYNSTDGFKVTSEFASELAIIGEGYLINQATGTEEIVEFIVPRFIPDSIVNINLSSSGDASVFDLNGDILAIKDPEEGNPDIFYIIKPKDATTYYTVTFATSDGTIVEKVKVEKDNKPTIPEGYTYSSTLPQITKDCVITVNKI